MCITYILSIYTHVSVYTIHIHDKCKHVPPIGPVASTRDSSGGERMATAICVWEHSVYIDLPSGKLT